MNLQHETRQRLTFSPSQNGVDFSYWGADLTVLSPDSLEEAILALGELPFPCPVGLRISC